MKWRLHRPSFWPEARDPWAWQRALVLLAERAPVADPWPCWERELRGRLSRRSLPGLYGLRAAPTPPLVLGLGLLRPADGGWDLDDVARPLLEADRDTFQERLAELLVLRSAWVRLALRELAAGTWSLPRGTAPLLASRTLRVGEDVRVGDDAFASLPAPDWWLGDLFDPAVESLSTRAPVQSLSALHAPLYLFHALGWLDADGVPRLPDRLRASLGERTPATWLRRITAEEADVQGFVPFSKAARRLLSALVPSASGVGADLWADEVFAEAIARGSIEVHAWAPGQPRHGRGFAGDRNRKLVRWTIHDDFSIHESKLREVGR